MRLNKKVLEQKFQRATGCSDEQAQKKTDQYIAVCLGQIIEHNYKSTDDLCAISLDQLHRKLSHVQTKGKRYFVWDTFQQFQERIFTPVEIGSNLTERLTMARLNYDLESIIEQVGTADELFVAKYEKYSQEIERGDFDQVPIDQVSLQAFIRSNRAIDQNKITAEYKKTLDNNYRQAVIISKLASLNDDHLVQVHSPSNFGRHYYQGPNLQTTSKIVRHAALGDCHEYDIESSVFAWKLSVFEQICQELNEPVTRPWTLEIITHKSAIRRRLARDIFGDDSEYFVKIIKKFITAIGFGAPTRDRGFRNKITNQYQPAALESIIRYRSYLDRALNNPWIQNFIREQQEINSAIIQYCELQGMDEHWRTIPELLDAAGRLQPRSVIAYLYQTTERQMLNAITDLCSDSEILLTVHDCIYTRHRVDLVELRSLLLGFGSYFKIEHQQHHAYTWETVDKLDPFYDPRDAAWNRLVEKSKTKKINYYEYKQQDYDRELDPYYS